MYTAVDFELDERDVIKNEKVALDRLRVRQNVGLFLFTIGFEPTKTETDRTSTEKENNAVVPTWALNNKCLYRQVPNEADLLLAYNCSLAHLLTDGY